MPKDFFWELYDEIEKIEGTRCSVDWYNTMSCTYNKNTYDKLPEMIFEIDGKQYKVPRESLYVQLDEEESLSSLFGKSQLVVEVTYIDGWDEWLLGLTFLENYYAVYDMDSQSLGFAISKSSSMANL